MRLLGLTRAPPPDFDDHEGEMWRIGCLRFHPSLSTGLPKDLRPTVLTVPAAPAAVILLSFLIAHAALASLIVWGLFLIPVAIAVAVATVLLYRTTDPRSFVGVQAKLDAGLTGHQQALVHRLRVSPQRLCRAEHVAGGVEFFFWCAAIWAGTVVYAVLHPVAS